MDMPLWQQNCLLFKQGGSQIIQRGKQKEEGEEERQEKESEKLMTFQTRWDKCDGCLCDGCTKNCYKNYHKERERKYGCREGDNSCIDRRMQCNETEIV